ncbi:hypothetical protein SNE40_001921 [Patella caerulea]|uniref:CARD domain-containing protein n=1 Tax=Patella caerulea TaxID=87958 RepID=A0AAN8Q6V8_PATCE
MACGPNPYYDAGHHQKLNGNRRHLMSALADSIDDLVQRLCQKRALQRFELKEIQKVSREFNPEGGVSTLIDVLLGRDETVFTKFKQCLRDMDRGALIDLIEGRGSGSHKATRCACTVTRNITEQSVDDTGDTITSSYTEQYTHQSEHEAGMDKSGVYKRVGCGRMREPDYSEIWIPNNENLVTDFKYNLGEVTGRLLQGFVISDDDVTTIKRITDNVDAARTLVEILPLRGEGVLRKIIKALQPKYDIANILDQQLKELMDKVTV